MTVRGNKLNVRWMLQRDVKYIVNIENLSFEHPWCEEDFLEQLRCCNCIGMICENGSRDLVGFMIYELHTDKLKILNFAVHPDHRRKGVGLVMMNRIMGKLLNKRRTIVVTVRETNLNFQLFLRELRFLATKVHKGFYEGCDGYEFEFFEHINDKMPVQERQCYSPSDMRLRDFIARQRGDA